MPKYIKLFESFISEAAGDLITNPADTTKVKWSVYLKTFKLTTKKLGKMMFITDAETVKSTGYNMVVMAAASDSGLNTSLKNAGGIATSEQTGMLTDLPNGESNFAFSARFAFKITEGDGTAKIDSVSDLMDGIGLVSSAGSAGTSGLSTVDKMFGQAGVGAKFDTAMQNAGIKQTAAYLRLINDPALQVAANNDASIKTLLDAQAAALAQADKNAKEKEIEPKVKAALTAAITKEQNPENKKKLQDLLTQYKPSYVSAGTAGSAGTSGSAGVSVQK